MRNLIRMLFGLMLLTLMAEVTQACNYGGCAVAVAAPVRQLYYSSGVAIQRTVVAYEIAPPIVEVTEVRAIPVQLPAYNYGGCGAVALPNYGYGNAVQLPANNYNYGGAMFAASRTTVAAANINVQERERRGIFGGGGGLFQGRNRESVDIKTRSVSTTRVRARVR